MLTVYTTSKNNFSNTDEFIAFVLEKKKHLPFSCFFRASSGKPCMKNGMFLSVSHTKRRIFLAFCENDVGLDAEEARRTANVALLQKKYFSELPSLSRIEFLRAWTVKESAVKLLGNGISRDLKKIKFRDEKLFLEGDDRPVFFKTTEFDDHIVSACSFFPVEEFFFESIE